jgi:diguanylate cyclase (GGDEF)-like protein
MWHQFFDHVYAKRGMTWLTLMEPTMQKLMERYHLELPSIYRTETLKLKEEARLLEEKKQQLESDLDQLIKQVEEAKDQVVRDPLTHLYIQDMLKQLMADHFQHVAPSGMTRGLMLIHLDQLLQINRRYGKETGDESLRNLVYVLDQVKKEHVMLFKQSGPGIYALIEEDKKASIIEEAVRFRNAVAESTNFIEEVTASIAVVTCSEVDPNLAFEDRLSFLFKTLEKRMAFAKITGHGSIIDESVELPEPAEGAILLVDQDEVNRNMLYRLFKRIKYDVILADSVVEGYKILEKRPIDIVISEINLSKMDGFQLKMMMNESKAFHKIPFIMVSHNKTVDNIKRGNMLDVDLILEKPITPEELIGHVKRMKDRVK